MIKKYLLAQCVFLFLFIANSHAQSSNLPIVVINTNNQVIPNEPKITADMGIIYNGVNVRNNFTDPFNHYNGKIGIEVRGQSSQSFPMKSYSIELRNVAGASIKQAVLGMPSESDWVLYAPYTDKTLMRNFLSYTISRELGWWAANCRFVEVVLNNQYVGIYVLMEKIKRDDNRVNISKLTTADISGDAVTGGYIISIDKQANGWLSAINPPNGINNQKIQFNYVYPKITDIVPQQQAYIKSYVDSFETSLASANYTSVTTGYKKYINTNSFIDYMLVNELSRNVDGYRLSTYFYKQKDSKGGKLTMGPVWDYDLAFRNANYCYGSSTSGWAYKFNYDCPQDFWQIPFWWNRFNSDTSYQSQLYCRYKNVRTATLSNQHLHSLIDSIAALLNEAKDRHFAKWPILGQYVWPNPQPIPTTYSGEIATLKNWVDERLLWLDANMIKIGACYDNPTNSSEDYTIKLIENPTGTQLRFKIDSKITSSFVIAIYTSTGQLMLQTTIPFTYGTQIVSINIGTLPKGTYWIRGIETSSNKAYNFKFVK